MTERREAVDRLTSLFNSSSDAMVFATTDGLLLDVNEAFVRLTGYAREDIVTRMKYQEMTPHNRLHADRDMIQELFKSGLSREIDQELMCRDGSVVPVRLKIFVVRAVDGTAIGVGAIIKRRSDGTMAHRTTSYGRSQ
jgi:PAS domain S-box-containing protein